MRINYILLLFLLITLHVSAQTTQTITFPDIPVKGYGDVTFTLNATASSGLAVTYVSSNTAVATVSGSTVTIKTTGFSVISAYQAGNTSYAAATPVPQLLVVCPKATLTVTADNKSINTGTTTPAFTYTTTGFKKSETASVISGSPAFQSLSSSLSAGSYPIVINQGTMTATNYEFRLVNGVLTVISGTATPIVNAEDSILRVYPNPCSNYLIVENEDNINISIINGLGKRIMEQKANGNQTVIPVSQLPNGIYFIQINKNAATVSRKFIVKK